MLKLNLCPSLRSGAWFSLRTSLHLAPFILPSILTSLPCPCPLWSTPQHDAGSSMLHSSDGIWASWWTVPDFARHRIWSSAQRLLFVFSNKRIVFLMLSVLPYTFLFRSGFHLGTINATFDRVFLSLSSFWQVLPPLRRTSEALLERPLSGHRPF